MAEESNRKDNRIAIIVILAGLLTGGLLTYVYLQPREQARYTPEYPVADSQRIPLGSAETAPGEETASDTAAPEDTEAVDEDRAAETRETAAEDVSAPEETSQAERERGSVLDSEELDPAERATIQGAQRHSEARGDTDYVELTEERFIRLSAKLVVAATALSNAMGEDADPVEAQHILAERAAELLSEARIDPEDFWAYTRGVHSDPDRAEEMGEKILREAEKHTQYKITVEDVPGMTPTPVPGAGE